MSTGQDRIPTWLRTSRGDATQEWLAGDIERVTGWHITRDRYSKYESGSLPIGPTVLRHFTDYWASRDVPGPDDQPEPAMTGTVGGDTPTVPADLSELYAKLDAQADALNALTDQIRALAEATPTGEVLANVLAAAVGLAVRETLQAAGIVDGPPRS